MPPLTYKRDRSVEAIRSLGFSLRYLPLEVGEREAEVCHVIIETLLRTQCVVRQRYLYNEQNGSSNRVEAWRGEARRGEEIHSVAES